MALKREPRLSPEQRTAARTAIISCTSAEGADKVLDRIWSMLEGDMQDRITTLIHAARGVVDHRGGEGGGLAALEAALGDLEGREVAATSTKQLREGPWHGR